MWTPLVVRFLPSNVKWDRRPVIRYHPLHIGTRPFFPSEGYSCPFFPPVRSGWGFGEFRQSIGGLDPPVLTLLETDRVGCSMAGGRRVQALSKTSPGQVHTVSQCCVLEPLIPCPPMNNALERPFSVHGSSHPLVNSLPWSFSVSPAWSSSYRSMCLPDIASSNGQPVSWNLERNKAKTKQIRFQGIYSAGGALDVSAWDTHPCSLACNLQKIIWLDACSETWNL